MTICKEKDKVDGIGDLNGLGSAPYMIVLL